MKSVETMFDYQTLTS